MQTLKMGLEEQNFMTAQADKLAQYWRNRLANECPSQSHASRESIVKWLLGTDTERFDGLDFKELEIQKQAMEYRWRILTQRYLGVSREKAYRNLITRLGSLATLRHRIQTWISLSRDRQRTVLNVLEEVLQELLQSDKYMQKQMVSIASWTKDSRLSNALLFASMEEYCLRPVHNQPLLAYRFVNYLKRTQRGGLTQVPSSDMVRLVSEEILTDDSDNRVSLLDDQAIAEYQEAQEKEEQQSLRLTVQTEFENYLRENLEEQGEDAVKWLQLYLQGKSQDEISKKLNKSAKEVYRLREKISYHAVRVFALKGKPELVESWLKISIGENNLGLTPNQYSSLLGQLTPGQKQIILMRKEGKAFEDIAQSLKMKTHQVYGEWTKVYLKAQTLRGMAS